MPEYLSPGVYIEELSGPKPIEGVGTSTGAFVGIAERGPVNSPQLITNLTQFSNTFGGFTPKAFLAYGVQHFFTEGGTRCYVVRAFRESDEPSGDNTFPDVAQAVLTFEGDVSSPPASPPSPPSPPSSPPDGTAALNVYANSPGTWGNQLMVRVDPAGFHPDEDPENPTLFKLSVYYKDDATPVETFDHLSMNEFDGDTDFPNPNHVEARINGISKYITVEDITADRDAIDPLGATNHISLGGGGDGAAMGDGEDNFRAADLIGSSADATGLFAFDTVDDINIVAIPDLVNPGFGVDGTASRDATNLALTYCANRKDCFFVADTPAALSPQGALAYKRAATPFSGNPFNSKYGALYYPWIYAVDELTGKRKLLPPSGAVAGSYSAADVRVGVHKAPAGIEDGYLNSAADVERIITKGEHDTLNPEGVNVIRKFPDAGICIYGARTLSADPEWKYVNVRRLFIFLEESILKGTQSVVFEPNDRSLWKRIIRDVGAFLRIQWREGKLVGDKPEKAYFVKCDEETNPPESVDLGRLITLIGVAPSKPAEFVIFRIRQTRSGGDAEE
ncbi:MAG TPA: phage tail sheath C-terminal domain-containing protein [Pyrinomonadaceae bacterium]|jgi:hypothetical protein